MHKLGDVAIATVKKRCADCISLDNDSCVAAELYVTDFNYRFKLLLSIWHSIWIFQSKKSLTGEVYNMLLQAKTSLKT